MSTKKGFMLMYTDTMTSPSIFYVPPIDLTPVRVYATLQGAKEAMRAILPKFDKVTPILYGEAFPYDGVTFDQFLVQNGYAIYGLVQKDDDDDEPFRAGLAIALVDYPTTT